LDQRRPHGGVLFLVGLELKREFAHGELSQPSQVVLPAVAAAGGMAVPAAIYAAINWGDPVAIGVCRLRVAARDAAPVWEQD
jgi:Na+/H+ antiporter NhaA